MDKMARNSRLVGQGLITMLAREPSPRDLFGDRAMEVRRFPDKSGSHPQPAAGRSESADDRRWMNDAEPGGIARKRPCGPVHTGQRCDPRWRLFIQAQPRRYARSGTQIITISFIVSILYNFVGLSFAVQGLLSPLVAAILYAGQQYQHHRIGQSVGFLDGKDKQVTSKLTYISLPLIAVILVFPA